MLNLGVSKGKGLKGRDSFISMNTGLNENYDHIEGNSEIFLNSQVKYFKSPNSSSQTNLHAAQQRSSNISKPPQFKMANNYSNFSHFDEETTKKKKQIDIIEESKLNEIFDNYKMVRQKSAENNVRIIIKIYLHIILLSDYLYP